MRLPIGPSAFAVEQLLEEEGVAGAALEDALRQLLGDRSAGRKLLRHLARVLRPKRTEVELLVGAAALPAVRPVGPIRRHQHDPQPGQDVEQLLDDREARRIGPMEVVEHDEHRLALRRRLQQAADRVNEDPLAAGRGKVGKLGVFVLALADDLVEDRGPSAQSVLICGHLGAAEGILGALARPSGDELVDELADEVIRKRRCVGPGARPGGREAGGLGTLAHLERQAALPDPRLTDERDHQAAALARLLQRRLQRCELALASDESRLTAVHARPLRQLALQAPGLDRFRAALQRHLFQRREGEGIGAEPAGHASDEDLAGRGRLLEPGRDVHGIAADGVVALLRTGGAAHDLAGVHADADLERAVQLAQCPADLEGAAQGALRVIVVSLGGAEDRHHRVADVLLERPAESDDLAGHRREVRALQLADGLRVTVLGAPGEADEVREEDRHQAPLVR